MSKFDKFYGRDGIMCPVNMLGNSLIAVPPRNGFFTKRDWNLNNNLRYKNAENQQQIAERILGECERIREQTEERTITNKETTDRRFIERIRDIEFNTCELRLQRKEVGLELEALEVYKARLVDVLNAIQENALNQCTKCILMREHRIGIDLVLDEVEMTLQKEISTILRGQAVIKKALEQVEEQMRKIRACRYAMDRDLEHKKDSVIIDREGANLKPTDLFISEYRGHSNLDPANISKEEWEKYSAKNIQTAAKEIANSRPIRSMVDNLLKQVYEDLILANANCNRAFHIRIAETNKAKSKLEDMLSETIKKVEAMTENIYLLEKALSDKKGYIALAHTRLGKRAQRPGAELVKDAVCHSLYTESEMLKISIDQLQNVLEEARASLRHLLQTQMQLEEDINVKTVSLKIDEVECMTTREAMDYRVF